MTSPGLHSESQAELDFEHGGSDIEASSLCQPPREQSTSARDLGTEGARSVW